MLIIQSLLIAAPIFYLAFGMYVLARSRWDIPRDCPAHIVALSVGTFLLTFPAIMLIGTLSRRGTFTIKSADDE